MRSMSRYSYAFSLKSTLKGLLFLVPVFLSESILVLIVDTSLGMNLLGLGTCRFRGDDGFWYRGEKSVGFG